MELFGYEINDPKHPKERSLLSLLRMMDRSSRLNGGYYGTYFDIEGTANNESQLIKRYRDISMMGDVDAAIEDVVNDSISNLEDEKPVVLDLDNVKLSASVKKTMVEEFNNVLSILDFNTKAKITLDGGILMEGFTSTKLLIWIVRRMD